VGRWNISAGRGFEALRRREMRNRAAIWVAAALVVVAGLAVAAQVRAARMADGDEPLAGTWKVNLEKSKYDPGPPPKSAATATITIADGIETYKSEGGTDGQGNPISSSFTAKIDGQDTPVVGIAYADTVKIKKVNAHHYVNYLKKNGKVVMTVHVVVAEDGKSRTVSFEGKDQSGTPVHDKIWYDKQM
jgi:hypothetical protein